MIENTIRDRIKMTNEAMEKNKRDCENECLRRDKQVLQEFMIWAMGLYDGFRT